MGCTFAFMDAPTFPKMYVLELILIFFNAFISNAHKNRHPVWRKCRWTDSVLTDIPSANVFAERYNQIVGKASRKWTLSRGAQTRATPTDSGSFLNVCDSNPYIMKLQKMIFLFSRNIRWAESNGGTTLAHRRHIRQPWSRALRPQHPSTKTQQLTNHYFCI